MDTSLCISDLRFYSYAQPGSPQLPVRDPEVLAPNGRCMITYFLLNADSLLLINAGKSTLDFRFRQRTAKS
jgi:hypothetical protein